MKKGKHHATETSYLVRSTYGVWKICVSGGKISRIGLPSSPPRGRRTFKWLGISQRNDGASINGKVPPVLDRLMTQIGQYFAGERERLIVPLVLREDSRFLKRVWNRMRRIPFGKTISYGELADSADSPGACRAVGNVCAANPLPLLIPCHRVVGKRGLGGFSAGLGWKRFLLSLETRAGTPGKIPSCVGRRE
ncbi:MAG: methylated-DNA--[protein]-cysteine S-methyltransferase [bacterium]